MAGTMDRASAARDAAERERAPLMPSGSDHGNEVGTHSSNNSSIDLPSHQHDEKAVERGGSPDLSFWIDNDYITSLGYVASIEGLRGLAVITPMWDHVALSFPFGDASGDIGVATFFVLSGFLITGVLINAHKKCVEAYEMRTGRANVFRRTWGHLPRFYLDRSVRLCPALYLCVGLVSAYWLHIGKDAEKLRAYIARTFLYVKNWGWSWEEPATPFFNTWSLSVEEQFYVFWSIVVPLVIRQSVARRAVIMAVLIGTSFYVRQVGVIESDKWAPLLSWHWSTIANVFKMFLGATLRLVPVPRFLLHSAFAYAGLACMAFVIYGANGTMYDAVRWSDTLSALATVPIILGSLHGNWLLETQGLRFLGRISYAWYIWQYPILELNRSFHTMQGISHTALAFVFAIVSTLYVEEPIRKRYHVWRKCTK